MKINRLKSLITFSNILLGSALIATAPRQCNAPIKPIENKIVAKVSDTIKHRDILVIDGFTRNDILVDIDIFPDISHGEFICSIIENGLPQANIEKLAFKEIYGMHTKLMQDSIITPLLSKVKSGKKYDAINISMGVPINYYQLSREMGTEVTAKNLKSKSREIKDYLFKRPNNPIHNRAVMLFIDCLDSLSALGTKIYISGGNGKKNFFNALSLVDNAINVGSINKKGEKASYSLDNTLINRWVKDATIVKKTDNGYVLQSPTGDIYVRRKSTTSLWHIPRIIDIKGTSFASPVALVNDMRL